MIDNKKEDTLNSFLKQMPVTFTGEFQFYHRRRQRFYFRNINDNTQKFSILTSQQYCNDLKNAITKKQVYKINTN